MDYLTTISFCVLQPHLHPCRLLLVPRGERDWEILNPTKTSLLTHRVKTANRTLEDLDDYFDQDSGNPTIIPISHKLAKQKQRPMEAIEAEERRIAAAMDEDFAKISGISHVEEVPK